MGHNDCAEFVNENWLGAKMFWSHFSADENVKLINDAGFDVLTSEEREQVENGSVVTFLWVIARKRK